MAIPPVTHVANSIAPLLEPDNIYWKINTILIIALSSIVVVSAITAAKPLMAAVIITSSFALAIIAGFSGTESQRYKNWEQVRKLEEVVVPVLRNFINAVRLKRALPPIHGQQNVA